MEAGHEFFLLKLTACQVPGAIFIGKKILEKKSQ
jgi:hypothetical protein